MRFPVSREDKFLTDYQQAKEGAERQGRKLFAVKYWEGRNNLRREILP
jgi:hypothetical protein